MTATVAMSPSTVIERLTRTPGVVVGVSAELTAVSHGLHSGMHRAALAGGNATVALAPGVCVARIGDQWLAAYGDAADLLTDALARMAYIRCMATEPYRPPSARRN